MSSGRNLRAIALRQMGTKLEVRGQEPPGLGVPVHAATANAIWRHERAPRAYWQCGLVDVVAESQCLLRWAQEQVVSDVIPQFILRDTSWESRSRYRATGLARSPHIQSRIREFLRQDRAGPAEPNDNNIGAGKFA